MRYMHENVETQQNVDSDPQTSLDNENEISAQPTIDISSKAASQGHQTLEQFIANGGKEEDYQSPELFLALKEPLKRIKQQTKLINRQEREFNQRIEQLNKFHSAQLEAQRNQLISQRDAAIDNYDKGQAQNYQNQIDQLDASIKIPAQVSQHPTSQNELSDELQAWNNDPRNAWITQPGAKSLYAHTQFNGYKQQGLDDMTAIRLMESDIQREFREVNPNINGAPMAERGSKPGNKAPSTAITMNNLTPEERKVWDLSGNMWKDEKQFLQAVKDSREAAQ